MKLNFKKSIKTTNQAETATISTHLFVIIGAILIFVAPLLHIDLPKTNLKVAEFKKAYQSKFDDIENSRLAVRKEYNLKIITGDQKIKKDDLLKEKEKKLLAIYEKELKVVINENRIFGWLTFQKFVAGLGVRIPYLFFTLLIVYLMNKINTEDENLKKTFVFVKIALFTISFYHIIWAFWDKQDFPKGYYYTTALFLGLIASLTTISFLKYRKTLEIKLKRTINKLIVFIINSDKYIDTREKENQHFTDSMKVFEEIAK